MRDLKPFDPEKKSVQSTPSSRMDTFQRLARQVDSGAASSGYDYGVGKPVGPNTGAESLQHSRNRFLDSLQQMTQKAGMNGGGSGGDQTSNTYIYDEKERRKAHLYLFGSYGGPDNQEHTQGGKDDEVHHDAGSSQQREVEELTDQQKHHIIKGLGRISNDIHNAKKPE